MRSLTILSTHKRRCPLSWHLIDLVALSLLLSAVDEAVPPCRFTSLVTALAGSVKLGLSDTSTVIWFIPAAPHAVNVE